MSKERKKKFKLSLKARKKLSRGLKNFKLIHLKNNPIVELFKIWQDN